LQLIAEGYLTKQIAAVLSIKPKTVEKHRESLMDRLDIHTIAALTRYAVSIGMIKAGGTDNEYEDAGCTGDCRVTVQVARFFGLITGAPRVISTLIDSSSGCYNFVQGLGSRLAETIALNDPI
jgi:Bacterial regulatory proteins, luxR family